LDICRSQVPCGSGLAREGPSLPLNISKQRQSTLKSSEKKQIYPYISTA
jgi:hypothetical protein